MQQYYHILHHSPGLVFRFYQDISKLGRPEDDGSMSITSTMQVSPELFFPPCVLLLSAFRNLQALCLSYTPLFSFGMTFFLYLGGLLLVMTFFFYLGDLFVPIKAKLHFNAYSNMLIWC